MDISIPITLDLGFSQSFLIAILCINSCILALLLVNTIRHWKDGLKNSKYIKGL